MTVGAVPLRRWKALPLAALVLALALVLPRGAAGLEMDARGTATRVIDGDTIEVSGLGRVRLADIDAPEAGDPGFTSARDYLSGLVLGQEVLLDVDDYYGQDRYGRWVCVVYLRLNGTHLLNVNEALLASGHAVVADYHNEFDPASWTLYVPLPAPPPPSPPPGSAGGGAPPAPPLAPWVGPVVLAVALVALLLVLLGRGAPRQRRPR